MTGYEFAYTQRNRLANNPIQLVAFPKRITPQRLEIHFARQSTSHAEPETLMVEKGIPTKCVARNKARNAIVVASIRSEIVMTTMKHHMCHVKNSLSHVPVDISSRYVSICRTSSNAQHSSLVLSDTKR